MNVAVSHKELQAATKDLNEALGIEPKLKVIAVPAAKMGDAIIDAIAPLVENEAEIAKLAPATIVTYNKLVAVMGAPPQEDDSNPAVAQEMPAEPGGATESQPATAAEPDDCFGVSYDPDNPACAVEACSQAAACAEKVTGKKKKKEPPTPKEPKPPTPRGSMLDILCKTPAMTKEALTKALSEAGFTEEVHYKKATLDTVYSDCQQIFKRLRVNGLLQ